MKKLFLIVALGIFALNNLTAQEPPRENREARKEAKEAKKEAKEAKKEAK